jgi:hypothetical protein
MTMGVRSYVLWVGCFLQPDPVGGWSADRYAYTDHDPIETPDPTGDQVFEGAYAVGAENASVASSAYSPATARPAQRL